MKFTKNIGMLVLAIYLILTGLFTLLHVAFDGEGILMAVLAIVAGVFIVIGK